MSVPSILLVEDHASLGQSLLDLLKAEGYRIDWATDLQAAHKLLTTLKPSLIILDWMLPDGQGIDFLKQLRSSGVKASVIFLTARTDVIDKVLGLEMGASDYMTKPFEPRELLARIRARLRESSFEVPAVDSVLQVGGLKIDRLAHQVVFKGQTIDLVKKEFDLLMLLAENPGRVFSRDEILNKVSRTVDTHIMQLRQKVCEEMIETVRAVGYRMKII